MTPRTKARRSMGSPRHAWWRSFGRSFKGDGAVPIAAESRTGLHRQTTCRRALAQGLFLPGLQEASSGEPHFGHPPAGVAFLASESTVSSANGGAWRRLRRRQRNGFPGLGTSWLLFRGRRVLFFSFNQILTGRLLGVRPCRSD